MHIIYALLLQIITLTNQIDKTAVCNEVSSIKAKVGFDKIVQHGDEITLLGSLSVNNG